MTAPAAAIPAVIQHLHPPLAPDARPCEPGVWATCRNCGDRLPPCTGSPLVYALGRVTVARCSVCREVGS